MSKIQMNTKYLNNLNQSGMASILITLIMSVVITLVVVGFAQVSNREQYNALQNQLSTTAYYAAETGINDAINVIAKATTAGSTSQLNKATCGKPSSVAGPSPYATLYSTSISGNPPTFLTPGSLSNATYSCLLVYASPPFLYTTLSNDTQVIPLNATQAINYIKLSWDSSSHFNSLKCVHPSGGATLPTEGGWNCGISALRFDLVPLPTSGLSSSTLSSDVISGVIVPYALTPSCTDSGSAQAISSSNSCSSLYGTAPNNCVNNTGGCSFTIKLPTSGDYAANSYSLRISSVYPGSNSLTISAYNNSPSTNSLDLTGAEYVIDSTGTANGVAKRIRVAVSEIPSASVSGYAIQATTDICKRFYILPGSAPFSAVTESNLSTDCQNFGY